MNFEENSPEITGQAGERVTNGILQEKEEN